MAKGKRIEKQDLFAPDAFEEAKRNGKELLEIYANLLAEIKKVLAATKGNITGNNVNSAKDLKEFNSEEAKANRLIEEYNRVAKQKSLIQAQINSLESKENKELLEQKSTLSALKKEQQAKINTDKSEIGSLNQLIAKNKQLIIERNKLNLFTKEGRKRLIEINSELNKNNAIVKKNSSELEQQRLNVGNYAASLLDAAENSNLFGGKLGFIVSGIRKLSSTLQSAIGALQEYLNAQKAVAAAAEDQGSSIDENITAIVEETVAENINTEATLQNTVTTEANTAATTATSVATTRATAATSGFSAAMGRLKIALIATGIGALLVALGSLVVFLSKTESGMELVERKTSGLKLRLDVLTGGIASLGESLLLFFTGNFSEASAAAAKGIDLITKNTKALEIVAEQMTKTLQELEDAEREYIVSRAELGKSIAENRLALEDENATLEDKLKLVETAIQLDEERLKKDKEFLQTRSNQTQLEVELLKIAGIATDEDRKRAEEAKAAVIEAETESLVSRKRLAATRENLVKQIDEANFQREKANQERRIFLIEDAFTKEKEAIILKYKEIEREAGKNRENLKLVEQNKQKELADLQKKYDLEELERQRKKAEELEKIRLESALRQAEAFTATINKENEIVATIATENTEKLISEQKKIAESGGKANIQAIEENVNKELELKVKAIEAESKFRISNNELTEDEVILEKLKTEEEIRKLYRKTLEELEKTKDEISEIEKENQKKIDDDRKKKEEEFRKSITETTDLVLSELNKRTAAEIKAQEELIDKRKENISTQERLAEKGLTNQLAFEQKKLAEAEAEKARLEKEKIRREKVQAYFKAFSAFLEEGEPGKAAVKAFAQVLAAETIAGAFKDGVIDFKGEGTGTSDSNIVRISHGESVINAGATAKFKPILEDINDGYFNPLDFMKYAPSVNDGARKSVIMSQPYNDTLIHEIKDLKAVIKGIKPINVSWDSLGDLITSTENRGVKRTIKAIRQKPRL